MKHSVQILLILLVLTIVNKSYGQVMGEANTFEYNPKGQRIKREHNSYIQINREMPPDTSKASQATEQLLMKAYPNPTNDLVTIENLSWKDKDKAEVKLFDITGKLITTKEFIQAKDVISFHGVAPGAYQLHYYLRGKLTTWKVVKQ